MLFFVAIGLLEERDIYGSIQDIKVANDWDSIQKLEQRAHTCLDTWEIVDAMPFLSVTATVSVCVTVSLFLCFLSLAGRRPP